MSRTLAGSSNKNFAGKFRMPDSSVSCSTVQVRPACSSSTGSAVAIWSAVKWLCWWVVPACGSRTSKLPSVSGFEIAPPADAANG